MIGEGEHIHRLELFHPVAALEQDLQVTALGFHIAGDIDDLFRGALKEGA